MPDDVEPSVLPKGFAHRTGSLSDTRYVAHRTAIHRHVEDSASHRAPAIKSEALSRLELQA